MAYIRLASVEADIKNAVVRHNLNHLFQVDIVVVYNPNSHSKAVARIWGINKIFQEVLGLNPVYIMELLRPFKRLSCAERVKVIAHELAHIPATKSGALRPHNKAFWRDYKLYAGLFKCEDFPSLKINAGF
ncbi:putative metallopeptidase [Pyrobaculum aerophilum]|uniref:Metallopeptidase n=2 Tax=Pyrobaculum aerophilum TaxID=13773 RepID=A0A832WGI0_9CREN|nr:MULTISPECIES: putative metallopeptidase [Pyrobaculum]AAL63871.1 conserved hypothetical protein [Pyrobaculum aerophilum str. IM2]MCX8137872.1 putative metallopeptidase [Pyrobaculum aerophilum]HII46450.1 metallopeptidase [Pyrobaculum aerophilum]